MPICRYSFIYEGKQLCVLEEDCALKGPEEQKTCQAVHGFYHSLTPNEIKDRQKKLFFKRGYRSLPATLKSENSPPVIKESEHPKQNEHPKQSGHPQQNEHFQQIAQSKEKLKRLKIVS